MPSVMNPNNRNHMIEARASVRQLHNSLLCSLEAPDDNKDTMSEAHVLLALDALASAETHFHMAFLSAKGP